MDASLNLFTGGRLKAAQRARFSHVAAAEASVEVVEHGVFLEVAARYYGALLAHQQVGVQEEALRLFGLQLERAETRFASGAGAKFDVLQAKVAQANAKPPLVRARNNYRVEVDELRRVIGLPYAEGRDASGIALAGDWPPPAGLEPMEDVLARAMETRAELRVSQAMLDEARDDWTAAQRERAPTLEAYANYEVLNDQFSGDGDNVLQGWAGGFRVRLPIWNGGAIGSRIERRRSLYNQALLDDRDVRLGIEVEVRRAWFNVEEAAEILETADLVIEQAEEALRLAENRYKAGGLTQLDVIQSQLELTRARLEKAQAAHDYHVARARLRWAQGWMPVEVE
jgi:outer membrane protein TolC